MTPHLQGRHLINNNEYKEREPINSERARLIFNTNFELSYELDLLDAYILFSYLTEDDSLGPLWTLHYPRDITMLTNQIPSNIRHIMKTVSLSVNGGMKSKGIRKFKK